MLILTFEEVRNRIAAEVIGTCSLEPSSPFPSISIDTRTIQPGQAFLVIKGPRFDGHQFIDEALRKGASQLICSTQPEERITHQVPTLIVEDTTRALQNLGSACRQKWSGPLIAVTGSMGKTTTRSFLGTLLRERFNLLETSGNLNNEFGVPLSLLRLQQDHQLALLELGMNRAGEIRDLARICRPTAAILTNVAEVHLEFFEDVEAIAEAKGEIIPELPADGWLVYNRDDSRVERLASRFTGQKISFGFHPESDFCIRDYRIEKVDQMSFTLERDGEIYRGVIPMVGRHALYNLAAATAAARQAGISPEEILTGYRRLRPEPMRGEIATIAGITIWDESYNSNPKAVYSLLETVSSLQGFTRKWLVLGDMLELGLHSRELHRHLGRAISPDDVDYLVTVGNLARFIGGAAIDEGFSDERVHHFEDSKAAAEALSKQVTAGDLVLIKGSRGVKMDRIVERLKEVRV
ncbi:MAG TPA: UDP-N-acetylmuramoyl-tripeptide--D-alanyl-D-alanine ligase [Acidobacteriota bacterium]|nr:UDP-N-acetylmuramoyl-tripeptide--D-alanyl-D-alanine ligase [Acidobacteriota bacterium]